MVTSRYDHQLVLFFQAQFGHWLSVKYFAHSPAKRLGISGVAQGRQLEAMVSWPYLIETHFSIFP